MSYYNTVCEIQPELFQFRQAAINQDVQVLCFFKQHPGELFTPSEIWVRTGMEARAVPLTSVRRALCNLTADGYLIKTTTKRRGPYYRNESCWMYPTELMRAA